MSKEYLQWKKPQFIWETVNEFESGWLLQPGIHTIQFYDNSSEIDIYVNDYVSADKYTIQPVFFTGAIAKRNEKIGPFFSGVGMTNGLKLPMISVSDPAVDQDMELNLAWYTGNRENNFISNLIQILQVVERATKREMLFIGGSGGGFAALNVSNQYEGSNSVFVWNPQTDIYEYAEGPVKSYLRKQFNFSHAALKREDWKLFCRSRTDQSISTQILNAKTLTSPSKIIYLQNSQDWHRKRHLDPLWNLHFNEPTVEGLNELDENHVVFVHDFAKGHNPPPGKRIGEILAGMLQGEKTVKKLLEDIPSNNS